MSVGLSSPSLLRMLDIEERRSIAEYAEQEIVLTQEASPFVGKFSFDRTPHLREILDDRERHQVWLQTVFASTQTSKTLALLVSMAKVLNDGDGMCQLTIPNDSDVVSYVEQKVDPFLKSIKSMQKKLVVKKDEDKSRFRKSKKQTVGSTLHIVGNTALSRSFRTIKHMFIDESRLFKTGDIEELIGRPLALNTPIPTPHGWSTMGELKVGDNVFDENGKPTKVVKTTKIKQGVECFDIKFDTGETITCDGDHEWVVEIDGATETLEAREMYRRDCTYLMYTHNRSVVIQVFSITPVESVPVRCIEVEADSHQFLCGNTMLPTHNTKAFEMAFRKVMIVSSWEREGDEAQLSYEMCDCQKELQTYCKECEGSFYAGSKDFKFMDKDSYMKEYDVSTQDYTVYEHAKIARKDVYIECGCGHKIKQKERLDNIIKYRTKLVIVQGDEDEDKSIGYRLNALASTFTPLESMADTMIKIADYPEKMSRFYRDYFNEIYQGVNDDIETDDFLLLSNGLQKNVIPDNMWKLILGVDNQKDHLYYELKAYCYGNISHSIAHGKIMGYGIGEDFEGIRELIQAPWYDAHSKEYYIDHIGIDKRGFNENGYTRTQDVNDFVVSMQEWAEENGVEDLIYATQGVPDIRDDKYLALKKDNLNTTSEDNPIQVLSYSNLKIKNRLSSTISRTISMVQSQDTDEPLVYKNKLFYINENIVSDAEERKANNKKEVYTPPQSAYESHLTSEVYDKMKGLWVNQKQKRNDYLDCSCICEAVAVLKGVDRAMAVEEDTRTGLLAMQKRFK